MTSPSVPSNLASDSQTFPRAHRILAGADFSRAFAQGKRFSSRYFRVHWCALGASATEAPARLGLAVSRKVSTRAVVRNRIKRSARESFRLTCRSMPAGDAVLVAYREAATAELSVLRDELNRVWRMIAALPASHAQGTICPAAAGLSPTKANKPPRESTSPVTTSPPSAAERSPPAEPTL